MNTIDIEEATKLSKNKKTVMISGVSGQDGSLMVDYLLKNTDHEIFGGIRRLSVSNHNNIKHLDGNIRFHLINFDLSDSHSISHIISSLKPDYFINFAAQSFVKGSWDFPAQTWDINSTGVLHILEAIRLYSPQCRFYNAGSSEEFGDVVYSPQDENHPLRPRSPYGASKAAARHLVKVYRESYNLFAIQGWLFNHEGIRRGEEFVTRKISKGVANIKHTLMGGSLPTPLSLGNIYTKRDWMDAEDCVKAVWLMLNNTKPKEYVVSSGDSRSIQEFVETAFGVVGIKGKWWGEGLKLTFRKIDDNHCILVNINPSYYRPAEVNNLCGNSKLIQNELGWKQEIKFEKLVEKMVLNDMGSL